MWIKGHKGLDKDGNYITCKSSQIIALGESTIRSPIEPEIDQEDEGQPDDSSSGSGDEEMNSNHSSQADDSDHDSGNYKLII